MQLPEAGDRPAGRPSPAGRRGRSAPGHGLQHGDAAGTPGVRCRRRRRCRGVQRPHGRGEHGRIARRLEGELHPRPPVASGSRPAGRPRWGRSRWVAPNSRASSSRDARRLTAMIVVAPASRAAMIAQRPTDPAPNTAIEEPGGTRSTSRTVPAPVCTPHASGPATRRSTSSGTCTTLRAETTARVPRRTARRSGPDRPALRVRGRHRAVRRAAAELQGRDRVAVRRASGAAAAAPSAGREAEDDGVARPHPADLAAHLPHDPRTLVADHGRQRLRPGVAHQQVGVAHAGGDDLDQHLVGAGTRQLHLLEEERAALLADDGTRGTVPDRLGHWVAVRPPSRVRICPVTNDEASEQKNSRAPTRSSGSAMRRSGMRATSLS